MERMNMTSILLFPTQSSEKYAVSVDCVFCRCIRTWWTSLLITYYICVSLPISYAWAILLNWFESFRECSDSERPLSIIKFTVLFLPTPKKYVLWHSESYVDFTLSKFDFVCFHSVDWIRKNEALMIFVCYDCLFENKTKENKMN